MSTPRNPALDPGDTEARHTEVAAGLGDPLRRYTLAKQQAATLLRTTRLLFESHGPSVGVEQVQALMVKLAAERFNLAVVGQFKRGKSSLMNAVIGRDLLPVGLLPLTSAITTLCYGPQERALLARRGWFLTQEIAVSELADYVTENGNPGNEKELEEARVELPLPFLRRGLYFIDTPGVGSAREANTATTRAFLPEADAVIFVTSVEASLSETEAGFLHDIRQHIRKLFVVVNKIDLLAEGELPQVLDYVRTGLEQILGASAVRLYPLSAQAAVAAKGRRDEASLRRSGLPELEADLTQFVAEEKSQVFLISILDRLLRLIPDADPIDRDNGAAAPQTAGVAGPWRHLREDCETLRAALLSHQAVSVSTPTGTDIRLLERAVAEQPVQAASRKQRPGYSPTATCVVCAHQFEAIFDFFAQWQYTLGREPAAQQEFAAARGFCYVHTWQFQHMASPLGISAGYASLVEFAATELRASLGQTAGQTASRIDELLPTTRDCAACRVLREAEANSLQRLLTQVSMPEGRERYGHSSGVCLPHLRLALRAEPAPEVSNFLLQEQVRRLDEIAEDMRAYVLKRESYRRDLLNADEQRAWWRALVQLTGDRTVRALWADEAGS
jgi:GTP-binding protein EngB required for normal cell division